MSRDGCRGAYPIALYRLQPLANLKVGNIIENHRNSLVEKKCGYPNFLINKLCLLMLIAEELDGFVEDWFSLVSGVVVFL